MEETVYAYIEEELIRAVENNSYRIIAKGDLAKRINTYFTIKKILSKFIGVIFVLPVVMYELFKNRLDFDIPPTYVVIVIAAVLILAGVLLKNSLIFKVTFKYQFVSTNIGKDDPTMAEEIFVEIMKEKKSETE